jgi:CHAT domain-containing protein
MVEDLLGRWAVERSQDRFPDAARLLTLAESLGIALAARGERMSSDSVQVIRVASADLGGAPILRRLTEGHLQYQKGLDQYRSFSLGAAVPLFEAARKALAEADSSFELWAQFQLAVCETQLFQYDSALLRLESLLRSRERDIAVYPALRAKALWVTGLVYGYRGAPAETLAAYREALEIFDSLGEKENRTIVANLLAEVHRHLDDLPGAWKFHGMALEGLAFISNKDKRWPVLAELGVSLLADDRARLSLYVQEELLRGHMGPLKPERLVGGLRRMAEAQYYCGNLQKALALIRRAKREADRVSETRLREGLFGDLLTLEGRIKAKVDPRGAVHLLSAAIESDEQTRNHLRLVGSLLERARLLRRERNFGLAEEGLWRAMQLLQDYRPAEDLLAASFEQVRQVFGEMVHLQVLKDHPGKALEFAERGRTQILSLMAPAEIPTIPVFTLEQIQKELPPDVALIEWWIGEKEIFSWTIRRDSFSLVQVPVDKERLHRASLRFRKAVSSDDVATAGSVAAWLYGVLLEPSESSLGGAKRIILVPDRALSALPFTALQRSPDAPYLIEERILSVAPSASLYLKCLRRERDLSRIDLSAVAFGNPSFDRSLFRDLTSLPYSEVEAEQIIRAYKRGKVLLGTEVTRLGILNEVANWPVLHIGGHTIANPTNPFMAALALAPAQGDNGVLYFRDLARARLIRTRLVVLSACRTLRGESGTGAEIAEPLLAQGVPAVLGTLWSIGDSGAQDLTADFHRRFAESRDAATALRGAQLALLNETKSESRPSVWAAFEVIGSH